MRAFLAVPLDETLRAAVHRAVEDLRGAGADVAWVAPENFHVTLQFLGEVPDDVQLDFSPPGPPFEVELAGIGMFGDRVVWAGVRGAVDRLADLARRAAEAGERIGVPREDRPWSAHVTVGRVKSRKNLDRLRARAERWKEQRFGAWAVRACVLMRSLLTPRGAVYSVVNEFPLPEPPRGPGSPP